MQTASFYPIELERLFCTGWTIQDGICVSYTEDGSKISIIRKYLIMLSVSGARP